eukprot:Platyproteum_vivax@DN10428_c0_g1_i1.p4
MPVIQPNMILEQEQQQHQQEATNLQNDDTCCNNEEGGDILDWLLTIPLNKRVRKLSRDFSDGVLMAELVHHWFPKLVDLHNYSATNSTKKKAATWSQLNTGRK